MGRLHELVGDAASVASMEEGALLNLLAEARILNALHVAEAVRAKTEIVAGLRRRIEDRDLENAVRDCIAENPWLLSPEWQALRRETSVGTLVTEAAREAGLDSDGRWSGRVDLAMSSGRQLLVVGFMRPGLTVDRDDINRYHEYMDVLRSSVFASTEPGFQTVSGLLVADGLDRKRGMEEVVNRLAGDDMKALEWRGLLERAEAQWAEFLGILVERVPRDRYLDAPRMPAAD